MAFDSEPKSTSDVVCTWCEYALHFIQEKLYDNVTQAEIRDKLEAMCAELPDRELAGDCKDFVDLYGPALEVLVAQK